MENRKDDIINVINSDIDEMKAKEAYKNKHGLYKKPPVQVAQKLIVDLNQINENSEHYANLDERSVLESVNLKNPPRAARRASRDIMDDNPQPNKRFKTPAGKVNRSMSIYRIKH